MLSAQLSLAQMDSWDALHSTCMESLPQEPLLRVLALCSSRPVEPGACVFPFTYYGVSYNECTDIATGGQGVYGDYMWCATAVDETGAFVVGSGAYTQC
jgi:hypothetical protein